ncbi:MAG: carbon storage regulator [Bryobacterales bacterium]|nr:carbon storage regulator [Bryobacterales bacterium]
MLIIRRRRGESIVIGEDIEIEILETSPTQVKLGISAPKEVTVLRSEIRVTRDVNRAASAQPRDPAILTQLVEQLRENVPAIEIASPEPPAVVLPDSKKSNTP